MSININNSRNKYKIRCKWWKAKTRLGSYQKLQYEDNVKGIFYCCEHQPKNKTDQIDGDIVQIDYQTVVIETKDNVKGINHNDLVEYLGQKWIVENVQTQMISKRSKFNVRPDVISWISLRNSDNNEQ